MKYQRTMTIAAVLIAALAGLGTFRGTQSVQARVATAGPVMPVAPTPTPCPGLGPECYSVLPSNTDGSISPDDCDDRPTLAIGCDAEPPEGWGRHANNHEHFFYLPPQLTNTGKLLIIFGGSEGNAEGLSTVLGPVAAQRGYHVIGLTYPAAAANPCANLPDLEESLACFGDALHEVVTGEERSPNPGGEQSSVGEHCQDSIPNRLVKALDWAVANYPGDGWDRYLTSAVAVACLHATDRVDWAKVHIGGHSNGSSHSSYMGTLSRFQAIGRVSLFSGPNDGDGPSTEEDWRPANYIDLVAGITDTRYYGLVHRLNKAPDYINDELYKVTKGWNRFGMEGPYNQARFEFNPKPGDTPDFGNAHILVSTDPPPPGDNSPPIPTNAGTTREESHNTVIKDKYCSKFELDPDHPGEYDCTQFDGDPIGYEPAWRCMLGTGDFYASTQPVANAGPDQTVECQGDGGANIVLDGSLSSDPDCDILRYLWFGPFGLTGGRNPSVFCPLGSSTVGLFALDDWSTSLVPDTMLATVIDTQPPSLTVTLTPTVLWPANHKMVRVDATVNFADTCGGTPPQVVLTSIISSQPDNDPGSGDTVNDIQDAQFGTFDRSFLLRAERAGGDPAGRTYTVTYTVTDASGNQTHTTAGVRVPH